VDFARLYVLAQACAFFVTRAKKNMQFYRRSSRPSNDRPDCEATKTILLTGVRTAQRYPDPLRRIHYFGCRERFPTDLPDQQFSPSRFDYHPVVSGTLESGIIFSLDQTAPAHQGFLRHLGERGEDPSLGGLIGFTCSWRLSKSNWGST